MDGDALADAAENERARFIFRLGAYGTNLAGEEVGAVIVFVIEVALEILLFMGEFEDLSVVGFDLFEGLAAHGTGVRAFVRPLLDARQTERMHALQTRQTRPRQTNRTAARPWHPRLII